MQPSLLACALGTGSAAADTSRPFTHDNPQVRVRPTSALGRKVIDAGMARSATFRRLVQRLESSDVIVYVQLRPNMPSDIGGLLEFMGVRREQPLPARDDRKLAPPECWSRCSGTNCSTQPKWPMRRAC